MKKIIAKEGLILIGVAVVLYFVMLLCRAAPIALPKYRAQFADGKAYVIVVHPDVKYTNALQSGALLKEIHNPPPKLVSKRIEEFAGQARIKSKLVSAECVNARLLYLSRVYSRILLQPFIAKVFFVYIFLLSIRFIAWAARVLAG